MVLPQMQWCAYWDLTPVLVVVVLKSTTILEG